jgi:hypothetical protein
VSREAKVSEFVIWIQSVFGEQMDIFFDKPTAKTQVNGRGWREIFCIV